MSDDAQARSVAYMELVREYDRLGAQMRALEEQRRKVEQKMGVERERLADLVPSGERVRILRYPPRSYAVRASGDRGYRKIHLLRIEGA